MLRGEIPREEWPDFFVGFIRTHVGHVCSLAVTTRDDSRHVRFTPMLLTDVGPDGYRDPRLRVLLTDWTGEQVGYLIAEPRHVLHNRTAEGLDETLEIEAANTKTTMTFQAAC